MASMIGCCSTEERDGRITQYVLFICCHPGNRLICFADTTPDPAPRGSSTAESLTTNRQRTTSPWPCAPRLKATQDRQRPCGNSQSYHSKLRRCARCGSSTISEAGYSPSKFSWSWWYIRNIPLFHPGHQGAFGLAWSHPRWLIRIRKTIAYGS